MDNLLTTRQTVLPARAGMILVGVIAHAVN